ncbi:MAG TPA: choline/ethanolamine kinase family protein [Steroidobacteraceae bacterium]|jgi:thiamine kinase
MHEREIERLGRDIVPGAGNLKIEHLSSGLLNEVYRILRDDAAYVLRLATEHPVRPGLELPWVVEILESAAGAGIAPRLVHADPARGVLLLRWVDGRSWLPREAQTPACIVRMADLLRRVHALPIPAKARPTSPASWIEIYRGRPDSILQEIAASKTADLAALSKPRDVVCHSDLHLQNLIECDASLMLLDWEYAHVSDPLWDVAGWSANNDFDHESQRELLTAYLGKVAAADDLARFRLLCWLYDYVCLLWSGLYLASRGDPAGSVAARATLLDARLRIPAH